MTRPTTGSLFDDEPRKDLSLTKAVAQGKPVSKAQQVFQRLIAKIESKRERLKEWHDFQPRFNQRVVAEIEPLEAQLRVGQRKMVDLIDELLSRPARGRKFSRLQRAKLEQLLMNLVDGLLEYEGDEALEVLHDKYSDIPLEQVRRSEMAITQEMLNGVFGVDVGDGHGASNPEELMEHAKRLMEESIERERHSEPEPEPASASRRSKAGAAKAEAARVRREQAAKEVSQSLREVYRKLASALHPDRELDDDARESKTLLMQRVNQAYAANDLLTLLSLQLEIEQIDAGQLSSVPPQRLAHYNQILREQLAGLEAELQDFVMPFLPMLGWVSDPTPATLERKLNADLLQLRSQLRAIEDDLVEFRDPVVLREMLKQYRLEEDFQGSDDLDAFGDFSDFSGIDNIENLMEAIRIVPPVPGGGKRRKR